MTVLAIKVKWEQCAGVYVSGGEGEVGETLVKGSGGDDNEGTVGHYKSAEGPSAGRSLGEEETLYMK